MDEAVPAAGPIFDWLLDGARPAGRPEEVLAGLCARLSEAGLPLARVALFVNTLHPLLFGHSFVWTPGQAVRTGEAPLTLQAEDRFRASAPLHVLRTGEAIRRRIADPAGLRDFSILEELAAEGCTDYLIHPLTFSDGQLQALSWTTRAPAGFTDGQLALIEALARPLARVVEIHALRRVATTLLDTYVGHQSGERILKGSIHCGDLERIEAVVMLLDLRGFTAFSNTRPAEAAIARVNAFFAACVPAIEAEGGEVLKFMGDGLLAILPLLGRARAAACAAALRAAAAIAAASAREDALSDPPLAYGVALHLGEVLYGNIGAGHRLDFTAMGPVVNKAARLDQLASELGRTLLASAEFARHAGPAAALAPLGRWPLKGFSEPETVYGLAAETAG